MSSLPALIYNDTPINSLSEMLCLTDMWRAAGSDPSKRPADWARKEGAEFLAFIAENLNMPLEHIWTSERGRDGGTWAHWQPGLAYAKYLSTEFHAYCNGVIRTHMEQSGKTGTSLITLEAIGGLFDQKLVPVCERIERVEGNLIVLRERVDNIVPRRDFSKETREQFNYTVLRRYNRECPCCRNVVVIDDSGCRLPGTNYDHFRGRELNGPDDGWLVCSRCNLKLRDAVFKNSKIRHFDVFQDNRRALFAGHPVKRPLDPEPELPF